MELFDYLLAKKKGGGSSGGLDWQAIGYSSTPQALINAYDYATYILENWTPVTQPNFSVYSRNLIYFPLLDTSNVTSMSNSFSSCQQLNSIPLLNTSNVTSFYETFNYCTYLKDVPVLDTSRALDLYHMFNYCNNLTDKSLNNILQMCINATSYTGTKTLTAIGITNASYYPVSRIQGLSNYQNFINAGWTIGY